MKNLLDMEEELDKQFPKGDKARGRALVLFALHNLILKSCELKCSVCRKKATRLVQVNWKGKEKFFPRCKQHVLKGYKGQIIDVD